MEHELQHCPVCGHEQYFKGICIRCRVKEEEDQILSLSEQEANQRLDQIAYLIEESGSMDEVDSDLRYLLALRGMTGEGVARTAAQKEIYYPDFLYYQAPADVRDQLVNRLLAWTEEDGSLLADHLLCCLAMQGDAVVLQQFYQWEMAAPSWREKLHVPPSVYAWGGGWTFDQQGKRQELVYPVCYPLVEGTPEEVAAAPVRIMQFNDNHCQAESCQGQLSDLLIIDGRDPRLSFLEIDGILRASCCLSCVAWYPMTAHYTLDGGCDMEPYEGEEYPIGEEEMRTLAQNQLVLAKEPVPAFYGCASYDREVGTIGGFPNWVQDAEYRICPTCQKPMRFLAQIPWSVINGGEGTLYIEICTECQMVSVCYQQT